MHVCSHITRVSDAREGDLAQNHHKSVDERPLFGSRCVEQISSKKIAPLRGVAKLQREVGIAAHNTPGRRSRQTTRSLLQAASHLLRLI